MIKTKYTLNTELRLEPILLSLVDENYLSLITQLKESILDYSPDVVEVLNKYIWIANSQLGNHALNKETLKKEFPELIFSEETQAITDAGELIDYIQMYSTQRKQRFLSNKFTSIADTVRTQGLSDSLIEDIYKYLSLSETETGYESIVETFKDKYIDAKAFKGLSFLCPELDKCTGGIMPGQVCTIVGAPGSMKTTYTSNIAYNAVKEGKNVLYLSLEEQPMQLYSKWLSRASIDSGTPLMHQDIIQRTLEEKDQKLLFDKVIPYFESLPGNLYIVGEQDLPNYSLSTLESVFKEIDKKAQDESGHGIEVLVVDHIQLLKFAVAGLQENTVINMYVSFFRQQSLSWLHNNKQISVFILSQANREGIAYAQKHDGQYLSQHMAEASEIERASAYIVSVYTDPMIQITKQLKLGAVKLRGSALPIGTIAVGVDGEFYQVGDTALPDNDYSSVDIDLGQSYQHQETMDTNQMIDLLGDVLSIK